MKLNQKIFAWILIGLSAVGFIASLILSYEIYQTALSPERVSTCDLSPILSCQSLADTKAGSLVLGIPNPFLGLAAFGALAAVGVTMLAGARFKDWFWRAFYLMTLGGMALVAFFIAESLYVTGALCIYCMITWTAVIALFVYTTIWLAQSKLINIPKPLLKRIWPIIARNHLGVVLILYLLIFGLILFRFRDYFETVWF